MSNSAKKYIIPKIHFSLSGQYAKAETGGADEYDPDAEATCQYDMRTYSFTAEYLTSMQLRIAWRLEALRKGVMIFLDRDGNQVKLLIESPQALLDWEDSLLQWTQGKQ